MSERPASEQPASEPPASEQPASGRLDPAHQPAEAHDADAPALAAARAELDRVDEAPLEEHAALLARVHERVTEELDAIDAVARATRPRGGQDGGGQDGGEQDGGEQDGG